MGKEHGMETTMENTREKLMIVDDSKFQRTVLSEMLGDFYDLIEVESGEECLKMFNDGFRDVDMVLLDVVMAGIDGLEVLRQRQHMKFFKDIPVIVLTTSNSYTFHTEAFELGADEYIEKPVDSKIALTRIRNIMNIRHRMQQLLQKQEELKVMSEIDGMTKLFNKRTTEQLVTDTLGMQSGKMHAFMTIDIDNFKAVNDIFGHKVGDHTIYVVAGILSSNFRDTDYIGRVGGDEFVVLMRNVESKEHARAKAASLIKIIKEKENLTIPQNISLSIGLAFSDNNDHTYTDLFNKADKALYNAKAVGKGCYREYGHSNPDMQECAERKHILAYTSSRNVLSMLEFAADSYVSCVQVHSADDIIKEAAADDIAALYLDISESDDAGGELLSEIENIKSSIGVPVIVICHEGALTQIKNAVSAGVTDDILLAPMNADTVSRRMSALGII